MSDREVLSDHSRRRLIPHAAAMAALDELDYRKQNGRFPIEQVTAAILAALPYLVDEAAERIFANGLLDEIAEAGDKDTLIDRDCMADCVTAARLALASDEETR